MPVIETPAHIAAAERFTRETNARYLTAILEGRYSETYLAAAGADAPKFTAEEMSVIGSPLDFVGTNIYFPRYVRAIDDAPGYELLPFSTSHPRMAAPWSYIGGEALYWGARHLDAALERCGHLHHRKRLRGRGYAGGGRVRRRH